MCLAQGPQRSDAGEARTCGPSALLSRVKHSTTEPLRSHCFQVNFDMLMKFLQPVGDRPVNVRSMVTSAQAR